MPKTADSKKSERKNIVCIEDKKNNTVNNNQNSVDKDCSLTTDIINKTYRGNRVAIGIPCYNEEVTIGRVIEDIRTHLQSAYIYVFNNNSTDKTEKIASTLLSKDEEVIKVKKQGKGNVVLRFFFGY